MAVGVDERRITSKEKVRERYKRKERVKKTSEKIKWSITRR